MDMDLVSNLGAQKKLQRPLEIQIAREADHQGTLMTGNINI